VHCLDKNCHYRGVRGGSVAALLTGSMLLALSPEGPPRAPATCSATTCSSPAAPTCHGISSKHERCVVAAAAINVRARGVGDTASTTGVADKLDSSFSRSRSSSMSSLENITSEAVQCLAFADSYTKKSGEYTFVF
jgi:hypothetical protein